MYTLKYVSIIDCSLLSSLMYTAVKLANYQHFFMSTSLTVTDLCSMCLCVLKSIRVVICVISLVGIVSNRFGCS